MLYIETNSKNVYFNFATEYYLLHEKNLGENLFMFWHTTPTLMVGRFQNIAAELNLKYAKEHTIAIARRQSGGGTIYTDEGSWQYSYILPDMHYSQIDFKETSLAVVKALNEFGVPAYFNERNDILVDNRKVSGTSRYVTKNGIVHHGSLLYDTDFDRMAQCITVDKDKLVSKGIQSVRQRVANIKDYMPVQMSSETFKKNMLCSVLGKDYANYTLTDRDIKRINEIRESIFENWKWNWGSNPQFETTKTHRFSGGKLEISYTAQHGIIESIHFTGDFFYDGDILKLEKLLYGCPLNEHELLTRLNEMQCEGHFYQIDNHEIALLILE